MYPLELMINFCFSHIWLNSNKVFTDSSLWCLLIYKIVKCNSPNMQNFAAVTIKISQQTHTKLVYKRGHNSGKLMSNKDCWTKDHLISHQFISIPFLHPIWTRHLSITGPSLSVCQLFLLHYSLVRGSPLNSNKDETWTLKLWRHYVYTVSIMYRLNYHALLSFIPNISN